MVGRSQPTLRGRSLLYTQLAHSLDAGLPLSQALRMAGDSSGRTGGSVAAAVVARGGTLVQALEEGFGLPADHRLALATAERAGRLPPCLQSLAADVDAERHARRRIWERAAYPLLLLHAIAPATSASLLLVKPGAFAQRVVGTTAAIWRASFARFSPRPTSASSCEPRAFTIANSAATKNPFRKTRKAIANSCSPMISMFAQLTEIDSELEAMSGKYMMAIV